MPIKIEHRCGHKKKYSLRPGRIAGAAEFLPQCQCGKCIRDESRGRVASNAMGPKRNEI